MSKTTADINELIEVLNDGVSFYDDAATWTDNAAYRQVFLRMARSKRAIVTDLKAHVSQHGESPADGGTIAGALRKTYTDVRARMSSDPDAQYIDHLEETEDRILQAFQDGLTTAESAEVRQIAQQYLPDVRRMHHEMRSLKQQVKAA
jgi:uncharacterized protein (TIGR02284 family)